MFGLVSYLVIFFTVLQFDLRSSYGYVMNYWKTWPALAVTASRTLDFVDEISCFKYLIYCH